MNLSRHSVEMLIDLVENKLSSFEVFDRDDKREQMLLERCLRELKGAGLPGAASAPGAVMAGEAARRRGRRPKHLAVGGL